MSRVLVGLMAIVFSLAFVHALAPPAFAAGEGEVCGTIAGIECDKPLWCDLRPGKCGAVDLEGACVAVPEVCTDEYDPVCDCSGKTHSNDCERRAKKAQKDHDGGCKKRAE